MYAVREILAEPVAAWDDPTAWTAPGSGNATNGSTYWSTGQLYNAAAPDLGYTLSSATHCSKCHAQSGLDLKKFNYSNWVIEQRVMFHGGSWQNALDVAAFIRNISYTPPASAEPWNPPYQPGPGLDSGTTLDWGAGAGIDSVVTFDTDWFLKYACTDYPTCANFNPANRYNTHEQPLQWQLMTWNDWLPPIYQTDAFPTANFESSTIFTAYQTLRTALGTPPATFNTFKSAGYLAGSGFYKSNLDTFFFATVPTPLTSIDAPSKFYISAFSQHLWFVVKNWEIFNEFQLEGMYGQATADVYGACVQCNGGAYIARGWFNANIPFNVAYHKSGVGPNGSYFGNGSSYSTPLNGNSLDGTNQSYQSQTNDWYIGNQAILNPGNGWATGDITLDWPYTWGFLAGTAQFRPAINANLAGIVALQAQWEQTDLVGGMIRPVIQAAHFQFNTPTGLLVNQNFATSAQQTVLAEKWADARIAYESKWSTGTWQSYASTLLDNCTGVVTAYLGSGSTCDDMALALPYLVSLGVTGSKITTLKTWAGAVWTGWNFDQDVAAGASGNLTISSGAATYVSGTDFTNFAVDGTVSSAGPVVRSYVALSPYDAGHYYPITSWTDNHHLTLGNNPNGGGAPPNGTNVVYKRCFSYQGNPLRCGNT
jgi:hypothetical protein